MTETTYACLLFAVNVGGRKVPSGQLRELAEELGFAGARTVANSGNVVVRPGRTGLAGAEAVGGRLSAAVAERFGVDAAVAVLTGRDLADAIAANPFPDAARDHPARLQLLVGVRAVDADAAATLAEGHAGTERLACAHGRLYVDYPDGIGASRLTARRLERAAGTPVTGRNWNTVLTLAELTGAG